jgi:hypothetical protein
MGKSMAKRSNEPIPVGKAKVRVFFAEVEGNDESVQEALKTMVSAMSRPVRVISDHKINGRATTLLEQTDTEEVEDAISDEEEVPAQGEDQATLIARKPRSTGKRDRNAGLALVPDLNFRANDQQTLKEFVDQKSPKNDLETTLTVVYYMQHSMKLPKIGPAHVLTAFKETGKAVLDLRQTVRNVKNNRMWLNFADIEDVRTTTQGDNYIEHDMGKSE